MKELSTEEKKLLLKDLYSRLPYGVICKCYHTEYNEWDGKPFIATYDSSVESINSNGTVFADGFDYEIGEVRPYLRPMSSMTDEEILKLYKIAYTTYYSDSLYYKNEEWLSFRDSIRNNTLCFESSIWLSDISKVIDYLNANKFDYRGLIPMDLALEAPKDMYS